MLSNSVMDCGCRIIKWKMLEAYSDVSRVYDVVVMISVTMSDHDYAQIPQNMIVLPLM